MLQKFKIVLGIIMILVTAVLWYMTSNELKQSPDMGEYILIAKDNIPEGTYINNIDHALQLFETRKVAKADIVAGAIRVNALAAAKADGVFGFFQQLLFPTTYQIQPQDLQNLVGQRVSFQINKNQQVINTWLVKAEAVTDTNERLYAVETKYLTSVAGDIKQGNWVDIWIYYPPTKTTYGFSEKLIGPLCVYKAKDENKDIKKDDAGIPVALIFSLTEEEIEYLSAKANEGQIFFTKIENTPSEDQKERKIYGSKVGAYTVLNQKVIVD